MVKALEDRNYSLGSSTLFHVRRPPRMSDEQYKTFRKTPIGKIHLPGISKVFRSPALQNDVRNSLKKAWAGQKKAREAVARLLHDKQSYNKDLGHVAIIGASRGEKGNVRNIIHALPYEKFEDMMTQVNGMPKLGSGRVTRIGKTVKRQAAEHFRPWMDYSKKVKGGTRAPMTHDAFKEKFQAGEYDHDIGDIRGAAPYPPPAPKKRAPARRGKKRVIDD